MKQKLLDRFLYYISFDTKSEEGSSSYPSTASQREFALMLRDELRSIGLADAEVDENSYVTASLPSTAGPAIPVVGFIAHMDTSPDMPGHDIRPNVIGQYDGNDIILNKDEDIVLKVGEYPELKNYTGQTLITTGGKTLLGADDKAGIAEIITAVEYLIQHPEIQHCQINIAFTPDEEIGKGVEYFDVQQFGADFAYTVDGGAPGELEYENFNAAKAHITIRGNNIHPGYAKGKMLNALHLAEELSSMLPSHQRPEHTMGYEGFFHLIRLDGTVESAMMQYIIRDHDKQIFENKKKFLEQCIEFLNNKYHPDTFSLELNDQYYNMREKIEPVFHIVEYAKEAMIQAEIEPLIMPIRGGTDGARLSFKGLPCPNIFAGGHNFHGKHEYIALESMEKAVQVILNIIRIITTKHQK
jgi:tripeptide aminopeptidase